ncbi:Allantoate permease [Rasamsonia emersonii CBS 393.64]|uniref:Allantoate permease n=1 Tax=Rasamsonia emersonii (strain ATCC 16479 / CBS 393.64 / IMI 116815) TaxID=1408163 RepID=A0A0F4YZD8_RASE3|nr:Allantoate permease [Rasamsonia emersonii CBS 393.64]KKA23003.1 Allantoate permease [Rasamsonia emersonii CBS 393.64]
MNSEDPKKLHDLAMKGNQAPAVEIGAGQSYDTADERDVDIAARILATADHEGSITQEEMDAVRWKIDRHMVPMLFVCLQLSGWDKVVVGTEAIYGMIDDLGLSGYQYSWVGSIMYFVNIFLWGVVEMCHAACTNTSSILVCRFLLGLFQCCDLPAMIIIATMWWRKSEQPVRSAMTCAVTSSIGNGLISFGFGHLEHSALPKWKHIFLSVGGLTVLYGALMFFILPDSPADASWLSEREKIVAIERLRDEKLGIENKHWKWEQAMEAVTDWKNWILWFFFISVNIPNGGLISFSTIIINSLGFSAEDSSLMTIPTALPRTNKAGQLIGLYMLYVYWAPYVCGLALFQANTAGRSKKTTVNAMDYFAYAIGNIISILPVRNHGKSKADGLQVPKPSWRSRHRNTPAPLSQCSSATASASCWPSSTGWCASGRMSSGTSCVMPSASSLLMSMRPTFWT